MVQGVPGGHAGAMSETPPEPPGSTATQPGPSDESDRGRHTYQAPGPGVHTDHLRDYRSLRRDVEDRKIAGVCGGLARHLDVDPTLVRVVVVVLALFGGAGLVLYAALWLFVPEHGTESALVPVGDSTRNVVVVTALVVALLIALPSGLSGDGGAFVGLLIVGGVVAAVLMARDATHRGRQPSAAPAWTSDATGSAAEAGGGGGWAATGPGGATVAPPPAPRAPSRRPVRRGPILFGLAFASVVLALGVLGLVDVTGLASVPDAGYPALALAVVGGWLVVGSVLGRPGGLVLLGLVALLALGATSMVEPRFEGDRALVVRPTSVGELERSYEVPAGRAEIDLRGIRNLEALDGRRLDVDVNAGEIALVVPEDLTVDLAARVSGGGEISTPDQTRDGWGATLRDTVGDGAGRATIEADLQVGFGRIHVRSE
jgi:phage shock protein PspC (stress-responsive transcriptional regulator)